MKPRRVDPVIPHSDYYSYCVFRYLDFLPAVKYDAGLSNSFMVRLHANLMIANQLPIENWLSQLCITPIEIATADDDIKTYVDPIETVTSGIEIPADVDPMETSTAATEIAVVHCINKAVTNATKLAVDEDAIE